MPPVGAHEVRMQKIEAKRRVVFRAVCGCLGVVAWALPLAASAQTQQSSLRLRTQGSGVPQVQNQLQGTVVDASGSVIAGAMVQVQRMDGVVQGTTRSDGNGAFIVAGLSVGTCRLVVSATGFEVREMAAAVFADRALPLRVLLVVDSVRTTVDVRGREDDLLGIADSASQGTVGAREMQDRPILRSGEILETIPGVIITQHAGGGKANQYFLRGFNLDHGTDFAVFLDGMPLNLPSHAHGEGYADMNAVIPEMVERVNYEKGPYAAEVGNYSSAGTAHLDFFKALPQNFLQVEGGMFGYGRAVLGVSQGVGKGTLLYSGELSHENGPWIHPDNYLKANGLLTYTQGDDANGFRVTARGYHGTWHSSDQIAENAVPLVGLFGTLNPTDGGRSQRYSLQGDWHREGDGSLTRVLAYGARYDLDLFSDYTYFLTDPRHGDQFEQQDGRWIGGIEARHTQLDDWFGHKTETSLGLQVRSDWIQNGLFQAENRVRKDKVDAATGGALPATTQADRLTDTQVGLYAESRVQWAEKFRSVVAVRGDVQRFGVTSLVTSANSGTAMKVLPSPKVSLSFGPWFQTEIYTQAGFSFHSNDGRGTTLTVEPVSGDNPYAHTAATPIPALIPTKGGEVGVRTAALTHLQSTVSLWYLHSASELQQSGDTGGTVASQQPSERYGIEWANFYTPNRLLAFDFDLASSKALFTTTDGEDAAPESAGGKRVPEAVGLVIATGLALHDLRGFQSSLRLRYFGPRGLTSDGVYRSKVTALLNAEAGYRFNRRWSASAEVLNLLDRRDHDIDYAYASQITPTAAVAFTDVFHPVEPIQARFWLKWSF